MSEHTVSITSMVLARWGDGSFKLTGWGICWVFFALSAFGTFARDMGKFRVAKAYLRRPSPSSPEG